MDKVYEIVYSPVMAFGIALSFVLASTLLGVIVALVKKG